MIMDNCCGHKTVTNGEFSLEVSRNKRQSLTSSSQEHILSLFKPTPKNSPKDSCEAVIPLSSDQSDGTEALTKSPFRSDSISLFLQSLFSFNNSKEMNKTTTSENASSNKRLDILPSGVRKCEPNLSRRCMVMELWRFRSEVNVVGDPYFRFGQFMPPSPVISTHARLILGLNGLQTHCNDATSETLDIQTETRNSGMQTFKDYASHFFSLLSPTFRKTEADLAGPLKESQPAKRGKAAKKTKDAKVKVGVEEEEGEEEVGGGGRQVHEEAEGGDEKQERAVADEVPPQKKKDKKEPKPSPPHPPYAEMIRDAIFSLKERGGSSPQAISKFLENKYQAKLPPNFKKMLSKQLKNMSELGKLIKVKNSFKLSDELKKHQKLELKKNVREAAPEEGAKPSSNEGEAKKPKPKRNKAKEATEEVGEEEEKEPTKEKKEKKVSKPEKKTKPENDRSEKSDKVMKAAEKEAVKKGRKGPKKEAEKEKAQEEYAEEKHTAPKKTAGKASIKEKDGKASAAPKKTKAEKVTKKT